MKAVSVVDGWHRNGIVALALVEEENSEERSIVCRSFLMVRGGLKTSTALAPLDHPKPDNVTRWHVLQSGKLENGHR